MVKKGAAQTLRKGGHGHHVCGQVKKNTAWFVCIYVCYINIIIVIHLSHFYFVSSLHLLSPLFPSYFLTEVWLHRELSV